MVATDRPPYYSLNGSLLAHGPFVYVVQFIYALISVGQWDK